MGYTCTFVSLAGKTCVVTVAGGGTAITGAANPFEIEENDSDDLLDFIRYKSGHLRIVEMPGQDLSGLFPTSATSHPVEMTYDGELVFKGYLQPQTFNNDWKSKPRVMEFPVISPLGIAEKYNFVPSASFLTPGGYEQIGALLAAICSDLGYTSLIFPRGMFPHGTPSANMLTYYVKSLTIAPYSDDFDYGMGDLQKPITYMAFIEGLCKAFGMTAHDHAGTLIFTRTNWTGDSYQYDMPLWGSPTLISYSTGGALETGRAIVGNDNMESIIAPVRKLTLKSGSEQVKKTSLDEITARSTFATGNVITQGQYRMILLPNADEFAGSTYPPQINSVTPAEGQLTNTGTWLCAFGTIGELQEGIMLSSAETALASHPECTVKFLQPPDSYSHFTLKMNVIFGKGLGDMNLTDNPDRKLLVRMKCGSYYYDFANNTWAVTVASGDDTKEVTIDNNSQDGEISFIPIPYYNSNSGRNPIEVMIKSKYEYMTALTQLTMEADVTGYDTYKYTRRDTDSMLAISAGAGVNDDSVDQLLNTWRNDEGHIYINLTGALQLDTVIGTYFSYLATPQLRLDYSLRITDKQYLFVADDYLKGQKFTTSALGPGDTWRLMALAFYPWNDEYRIKLIKN